MHLYTTIVASGSVFVVALLLNAISSVGGKVDKETFLKVVLESINFIKDKNIKDWQNIVNFAATPGWMTGEGLKIINSPPTKKVMKNIIDNTVSKSKEIQKQFEK